MTTTTAAMSKSQVAPGLGLAAALLAVLTLIRIGGLYFSRVDLFFDEAQYWAWSRELAFGYFSKPPLLAWLIAAAEAVCGSAEACIRAPAPVLYFGTSLIVYGVARQLYDARVAFFAALSIALATGAVFSARIVSTDVPLIFFWAAALLAFVKLWAGGGRWWAAVLGLALGFGLLAKYAMIYFLPGAALAAWLDRGARDLLRTPAPWIALLIAAVVVAPNIAWNLENGLATFRHTGANIEGRGLEFSPLNALVFVGAQFGVFGPVAFAVLLIALARFSSPATPREDRLMLAFAIPPLLLVTATAFLTRALANWAATAFVSGIVVVTAILVRRRAWKWIGLSLGLGVVMQIALLVTDAMAPSLTLPWLKNGDVYRRTLGWRALGEDAGRLARSAGARAIAGDQRDTVASLSYYWRDRPEAVYAWPSGPVPAHQFEITRALTDAAPEPILFVSPCGKPERLAAYFAEVTPLGRIEAPTGPTSARGYFAFKLDQRNRAIGPLAPCN